MKPLKLAFSDTMAGFEGPIAIFTQLLRERYDLTVLDDLQKAELLIYSDGGTAHHKFNRRKIYYTIENMEPDYDECDFAVTSCLRPDDSRHYRLPLYAITSIPGRLVKGAEFDAESILRSKTGFCCFVVTNPRSPERNRFFKILNKRKRVDSGGRHFNNIGARVANKPEFVSRYKFAITFENTMSPGYTTEKITDAMMSSTVPIYWGNPEVGKEFNTRSFINAADFPSFDALADHVLRVDADDSLYLQYLREPWFIENRPPDVFQLARLGDALKAFIDSAAGPAPRQYRTRRLREHIYRSPLEQSLISLRCRIESKLWDLGIR